MQKSPRKRSSLWSKVTVMDRIEVQIVRVWAHLSSISSNPCWKAVQNDHIEGPTLRPAHADEAAVVLASQGPEEGTHVRALEVEADGVDLDPLAARGTVPVGFERTTQILTEPLAALHFRKRGVAVLLREGQAGAGGGQAVRKEIDRVEPVRLELERLFETGI